jgi:hypothetical protein
MKAKKALLLFEVALVVLLVAIISVFLFRGYRIFIEANQRSRQYLHSSLLLEEKLWALEVDPSGLEPGHGLFSAGRGSWSLELAPLDQANLAQVRLGVAGPRPTDRLFLDRVFYLNLEEE